MAIFFHIWKDLENENMLSHEMQRNSQKPMNCLFSPSESQLDQMLLEKRLVPRR